MNRSQAVKEDNQDARYSFKREKEDGSPANATIDDQYGKLCHCNPQRRRSSENSGQPHKYDPPSSKAGTWSARVSLGLGGTVAYLADNQNHL